MTSDVLSLLSYEGDKRTSTIADLLGHTIQSATATYARSTSEALEDAVNRLTEP